MKLFSAVAGQDAKRQPPRFHWIVFAAISVVAVLLRVNAGLGRSLWEDEVISARHAAGSAWLMPIQVMRDDVHPFLYFLQLHFWSLLGDSDLILRLNSSVWSLLGLMSVYLVLRRLHGGTCALVGYGLLAVSAPAVWFSQELRPYSWMLFLYVWAFYTIEMLCRSRFSSKKHFCWAWVLNIALAYSHSLGVLIVFLLGCYALAQIARTGFDRRRVLVWLMLFGSCALLALPPVVTDVARDANLGSGGAFVDNLVSWPAQMLLPRGDRPMLLVLAAAAYGATAAWGVVRPDTRLEALTFLVAPIFICLSFSVMGVALFKQNVFCLITTPFFVMVLARLLVRLRRSQALVGGFATGAVFLLFCAAFFANRVPPTGFQEAAQYIRARAEPTDLVYVPQDSMFYGIARYFSVWPDVVAAHIGIETSPRWQRVYDRLGPWFVSTFQLEPKAQLYQPAAGPGILIGNDSAGVASQAHRVWLVTYAREDLPPGFPPEALGQLHVTTEADINFLQVRLYQ